MILRFVACWLCVLAMPVWGADHNPLLPLPREVRYGAGKLSVRGLAIRFASEPSPEDRFTAQELSSALAEAAGRPIPIAQKSTRGPVITLKRTGAVDALPVPGERPGPDSREAYSVKVTPTGAEIAGRSSAALFYGVETIRQLIEGRGDAAALPEVEIRDWPSLPYRGIMMDMSHGPLLTEAEVKRQIDFLARWKNNQYYFYSEASVELKGYPIQSRDAQFSQDEIRRIVSYARERHIDVVPCMELYGHLHDLFRVERYANLAVVPHGREFDPRKPGVPALMANWVEQLTGLFPSPFFHIGFDETREAPALAARYQLQPAALYQQQFQLVSDLIRRRGKTLLVWSDMYSHYPNLIQQLPPGTIVVPWGYDRTVYQPYWKPFAESPLPRFIATGVSIWDQISPNFDLSFDNIDAFLAEGRPHGVSGMINTLWTDDTQVLIRPAYPGMAYGAVSAWQPKPVNRNTFFSEYARIVYSAGADEVAAGFTAMARSEVEVAKAVGGRSEQTSPRFWDDPLTAAHLARAMKYRENFRQARLLAEDALEHFSRAIDLGADASTLSHPLLEARMLDYTGMKNLYAAEMADVWRELGAQPKRAELEYWMISEFQTHNHSRIQDLMDASGDLKLAFRTAWLESYTPYRLGGVMGKFDSEFQYWWRLSRRFRDYASGFRQGDTLRPLESFSGGN